MRFSVIIPNYNGRHFIKPLCASLAAQEFTEDFEIVFVDNGSTDNSVAALANYGASLPNLRILSYKQKQSSYAARNYGVRNSQGEILVFTDADCQPCHDWLQRIQQRVADLSGAFLLSGSVEIFPKGRQFNIFEWFDFQTALDQERYSREKTGATANLTVSVEAFERVNGFLPVISGGDREFCCRAVQAGARFYYEPRVKVRHPARANRFEIERKLARVGWGLAILARQQRREAYLWVYAVKQIIGMVLQPRQWISIRETFRCPDYSIAWKLRFCLAALYFGVYARWAILRGLELQ